MRSILPVASLLCIATTACSIGAHEARRTIVERRSATDLGAISCTSRNGSLRVIGVPGADAITIHAELSVRADSQQEAEQLLQLLGIDIERRGDELCIAGITDPALSWQHAPQFSFRLETPPGLPVRLETHNGDVKVQGLAAAVRARTHNGSIEVATSGAQVELATHNGSIEASFDGDGPLTGSVESYNGSIEVGMGRRSAAIEASSHNGSVVAARGHEARGGRSSKTIVAGSGGGAMTVVTHNGTVKVR